MVLIKNFRSYDTVHHISVLLWNSSFWFWRKSTPLLAMSPLSGSSAQREAFTPLSLFLLWVCRLGSLSRLLGCFHNGQIDLTIWEILGEMIFSRLAACFIYPNSGEQHWSLASHVLCWNRRHYKEYIFLEILQIKDPTLPEWRQLKYGVCICQWDRLYTNLALWGLRGQQSSDCCWIIRESSLKRKKIYYSELALKRCNS